MADQGVTGITDRHDASSNRPQGGGTTGQQARPQEEPAPEPGPLHSVVDQMGVADLAPGSIPPAIEAALASLTAEVERLRAELARAHGHEAWLSEQADLDPPLPLLNRRAFHRDLSRLLAHAQKAELKGCVIWLHLGWAEGLRHRLGLAAADAAMAEAASRLKQQADGTDPLASFGEGDFALATLVFDDSEAEAKAEALALALAAPPCGSEELPPLSRGIAFFAPESTADSLIAEAEARARGAP